MNTTKRCAEEISSIDNDGPDEDVNFPLHKAPRRYESPSQSTNGTDGPREKSFAEFLANALPVALIDPEVLQFLVFQSNLRLDFAKREGVDINELSIGDDCLPVWPGFSWDPSVESLHSTIQRRLANLELAQDLGNLVQNDIIAKGNRKLDEARLLGVQLESLVIGNGLLPVWGDDAFKDVGSEHQDNEEEELSQMTSRLWLSNSSTCVGSSSDAATMSTLVGSETSPSPIVLTSPNLVDDQAYYSEDDDAQNVVHDVEVAGAPRSHSHVDLEVYVANNDDEVYDLPEMEFAVDRDAFEYWHQTDEAIDVEVTGTELRCTGKIISIEEVDDEEAARVIAANAKANVVFDPIPVIEEPDEADDLPFDTRQAQRTRSPSLASEETTSCSASP
ncbi:hypothetical protein AUP68_08959 [Ilyonectria robusta]